MYSVPICRDTATQRAENFVTKFSQRVNMYVIHRCIVTCLLFHTECL